ncbi:unnamed protein product [Lactuca virosa]|uniref:Uncharacterized protein n=1 Tax=Lactuca virosa TaxID=75947 RepID=A0AAU9PG34_9ASTR|nr:unnamed protein product [Lactuca virosa]
MPGKPNINMKKCNSERSGGHTVSKRGTTSNCSLCSQEGHNNGICPLNQVNAVDDVCLFDYHVLFDAEVGARHRTFEEVGGDGEVGEGYGADEEVGGDAEVGEGHGVSEDVGEGHGHMADLKLGDEQVGDEQVVDLEVGDIGGVADLQNTGN